jgi:hypothetical protein
MRADGEHELKIGGTLLGLISIISVARVSADAPVEFVTIVALVIILHALEGCF